MMRWRIVFLVGAVLCTAFSGCNTSPTESLGDFRETLYVEGFLRAGNAVDSVFVGTTMPLYEVYSREAAGLPDAVVTLEVDGASFALQPLTGKPGYYHRSDLIVESGKTYRLTVTTDLATATAETTVPYPPALGASLSVLQVGGDPYRITWSGETETGYVTTQKPVVLEESIPLETLFGGFGFGGGFFGGGFDTTGLGATRDSLARAEQWRYVQNTSATINARQFSYYGMYAFLVYAIDENYADFLVSSQQDPQVLDEPRFHISGGIGLFASMAADSVVFRVD